MDAHTELAVRNYFKSHGTMAVDKVWEDGDIEEWVFTNPEELITEYNNAVEYILYMPI